MALIDNLQAYWKLDGNSNDAKGSNNGTDTDITYSLANGKIDQGAGFNGTSSKIQIPDSTGLRYDSGNITVAFWYNPNTITGVQTIIGKWANDTGSNATDWLVFQNGATLNGAVLGAGTVATSGSIIGAGAYYYVVFTVNSSRQMNLYVNNTLVASATESSPGTLSTYDPVRLGNNSGTNWYAGKVDEVAIWSRVITSDERAELYNSGDGYNGFLTASLSNPLLAFNF